MSATKTRVSQPGMYDWVARHTSEVEHEVIAFQGGTLELLRVAQACDAGYAALERQLAEVTRQRDELLAYLTEAVNWAEVAGPFEDDDVEETETSEAVLARWQAAIASARGTAAQP